MRKQILEATPIMLVVEGKSHTDCISVSRDNFRRAEAMAMLVYTYLAGSAVALLLATVLGELIPSADLGPWIPLLGVLALAGAVYGWLTSQAKAARLIVKVIRYRQEYGR